MTKDQQRKLFQAFTQADSSTTRKYGGTGLGLVITKRFTEMMHGNISVHSEYGEGSEFIIRLPINADTNEEKHRVFTEIDSSTSTTSSLAPHTDDRPRHILVIDDDSSVREILQTHLENTGYKVTVAVGGDEGLHLADTLHPDAITLDVMMPGMDGWMVLSALKNNPNLVDIPVIMLSMIEERNLGYSLGASEYLVKPVDKSKLETVLNKYWQTQHISEKINKPLVLVIEDDSTTREMLGRMLHKFECHSLQAENGLQGLEVLSHHNPDLILLDLMMPEMDGFELVKTIRQRFEKSNLVIIGLSGQGEGPLSAKFIKNGANDFLQKPFCHEEFNCRIMHNIESLELIEKITHQANHDFLTDLPNRRYFFEQGDQLLAHARQNNTPLAAAVVDLDSFKAINDTYGHEAGDEILKMVGQQFKARLSRFLTARTGGEEFCVLLPGLDNEKAVALIDGFREQLMSQIVEVSDDEVIRVSFSAGVTNVQGDTLDVLLNQADERLYRAKEAGRNMVIGDD